MELDEHVPVYDTEPKHLEYHAPSDDDIQVKDQPYTDDASPTAESPGYIADSDSMEEDTDEDSIDYLDEPKDGKEDDDEDPEEDPSKEHEPEDDDEDTEDDPNEEHELEDLPCHQTIHRPLLPIRLYLLIQTEHHGGILLVNVGELSEMDPYEKTELFEEDEIAVTPPTPRHRRARISVRPQTPMDASTQALIEASATGSSLFPLPPTSPAYDQAPLGHRIAMICMRDDIPKEDMPPQRRCVLTALLPSPGHDTQIIARAVDREEDVSYVRDLQVFEQRIMTSIEEVNLRISYQAQIDVVRGQRTAYETELQEVHQAYHSSKARNRALLVRLETLETHMSRMEWQRQSAEDLTVTQMMRIHTLEARARTDMVEDAGSSC
nr:hypothetical protein [Tanacetum cinerariifolium]